MRTVSPAALAALNDPAASLVLLLEMQLTAPLRFASSGVDITYGGNSYIGTGILGGVERVTDGPGANGGGLRFMLSGIPTEVLAIALAEPIRNKACSLRLAVLDIATHAVLEAPLVWTGTLDQMPISHQSDDSGGSTCTVSVTAEHRGSTFSRPKPFRYTDGDQRRAFPGDTSLRFVVSQANHQDVWPAAVFFRQ
jgi:hypothetical protein